MCYTSRDMIMRGWGRKNLHLQHMWRVASFLSRTRGIFPKSAEVGGKAWRKSDAKRRRRQGSGQFIAVAAHTFTWYNRRDTKCHENVKTQSLKRQQAQRKEHEQLNNHGGYTRSGRSTSLSKCKWCCQEGMGRRSHLYKKQNILL